MAQSTRYIPHNTKVSPRLGSVRGMCETYSWLNWFCYFDTFTKSNKWILISFTMNFVYSSAQAHQLFQYISSE